jgi:hypothetical protein
VLRGNGARLHLRRKVDARRVPRWGADAVDSLDSRRGAASCLALVAPPPPPSAGEATGQTRMSFFRHVGKTSLIPSPAGGLSAAIVAVARRRRQTVKGETRGLRVCPAPRSGALAVGGYKRPHRRERETCMRRPVLSARPTFS